MLKYGLVQTTLDYLDCICAPALTGIGLNSLLSFDARVDAINQCLITLTEYCQGPCKENQVRGHAQRRGTHGARPHRCAGSVLGARVPHSFVSSRTTATRSRSATTFWSAT